MAVIIQGNGGTAAEVDGTTFRAQRMTIRPPDHGALGAYSVNLTSGVIGAALAANSEIFQFRWSDATRICLINEIKISAAVSTTFFAAGVPMQLRLLKATGWSAAGSGGTRVTPAALLKKRTSMGSTLVAASDIGISSTAALTAGTKTLETEGMAGIVAACPITASLNGVIVPPGTLLYRGETSDGQHPLALVQNEGFVITSIAVPATGTWTCQVQVDWTEVTAY
jgi:hypothetical protein